VGLNLGMKKVKKNWYGLTPQHFPELEKYIQKEFTKKKIEKKIFCFFNHDIDLNNQINFLTKIVFSLTRQIPSNWKKSIRVFPKDPFIHFYITEFVLECSIVFYEYENAIDTEYGGTLLYDNIIVAVYQEISKLYECHWFKNGIRNDTSKHLEMNKYKYIYKDVNKSVLKKIHQIAKKCALKDSNKVVQGLNFKKKTLSVENILFNTESHSSRSYPTFKYPIIRQCEELKKYISKKII